MCRVLGVTNIPFTFQTFLFASLWGWKAFGNLSSLRIFIQKELHVNRKNPKNSDTRKIWCNHPKIGTRWLYHRVMCPIDADRMANSVDPDQTASQEQSDLGLHCFHKSSLIWVYTVSSGAVWSGSTLFHQEQSDLGLHCFLRSSLIWVYTVCLGLSVRKLRIITVTLIMSCKCSLFAYQTSYIVSYPFFQTRVVA